MSRARRWFRRALRAVIILACLAIIGLLVADGVFPFPETGLDRFAVNALATDRHGTPLLETVGPDDQFRRPIPIDAMTPALLDATIAVEDSRYRRHAGVDPIAVARAFTQNLTSGRIVSGASTLTMQVCRMMDDRPRTLSAKVVEAFRAVQLERLRTKEEILAIYLNLAPYGGNLRGVEAASRHWFGHGANELTIAEAALLAGLPQSPERLRPDRNPAHALRRRNHVLDRMRQCDLIDDRQHSRAVASPLGLRSTPRQRGRGAPHVAFLALARRAAGGRTTIDAALQHAAEEAAGRADVPGSADVAVVIIEIESGAVRAMVGGQHSDVNAATARRSPGSALKPFVYLAAFQSGRLAPSSIVPDVPIDRAGWTPRNFDRAYRGDLTAAEALRSSRNVPAILIADALGSAHCAAIADLAGARLRAGAAARAGLAIAVGATEVRLIDLVNAYATIGRRGRCAAWRLFEDEPFVPRDALDQNACAAIDRILSSHTAPPPELTSAAQPPWFAWKTGTSAGRRDAWAVGHNGRFAAGVWVGRLDGAGHDRFVGAVAAEPVLVGLFAHPELRSSPSAPTPPRLIVATTPIVFETEAHSPLTILHPSDGTVLVRTGAVTSLPLRANRSAAALHWFVDGVHAPGPIAELDIGRHVIRCIAEDAAAAVTVDVIGAR